MVVLRHRLRCMVVEEDVYNQVGGKEMVSTRYTKVSSSRLCRLLGSTKGPFLLLMSGDLTPPDGGPGGVVVDGGKSSEETKGFVHPVRQQTLTVDGGPCTRRSGPTPPVVSTDVGPRPQSCRREEGRKPRRVGGWDLEAVSFRDGRERPRESQRVRPNQKLLWPEHLPRFFVWKLHLDVVEGKVKVIH